MVARAIRSSAPRRIAALFGVITFATDYSIGIADLAKTVEEYGGDALAIYRASAYPIGSRSGRALRVGISLMALVIAGFVGWTHLHQGVHYLSDVVAAYLLAGGWLAAVALALHLLGGSRNRLDAAEAPR